MGVTFGIGSGKGSVTEASGPECVQLTKPKGTEDIPTSGHLNE